MTVADVTTQIADIQARLAAMTPAAVTSADDGAGFASALSGATATSSASGSGTTVSGTSATGDDVVNAALRYKGVPYVLGGESKSGIDCSGLVQAAFTDLGVSVPRLVHQQETIGQKVDSLKDAKPGDLIVLDGGNHIAIYAGNDTVIHAPYPGRTVSVQKAWFDDKDIVTIRRVVPASDDAAAAATATAASASATGTSSSSATTAAFAATTSGVSAATSASAAALLAMYGGSGSSTDTSSALLGSGGASSDSFASMLSGYGSGTSASSSTAQQLLAARAALLGTES